jgi:serine phosphatase RsbU (regulator of sigma subunit)
MAAEPWLARHGLAIGLSIIVGIVGLDVALGSEVPLSASYAVAAVFAGAVASVRRTEVVAVAAVLASAVSFVWNQNFATPDWWIRLGICAGLAVIAVASARIRTNREQQLRHMRVVAETAQRAVLRAMPSAVGSVGFAARYVSATEEALVGGDLYEVTASPYGIRVIVGDVRGKGLEAVQLAATVLGAFRRDAFTEPSLADIATDLDQVVKTVAGDEDFVTALLAEFHDDHTVSIVNCGHHPPLLVTEAEAGHTLQTGEAQPPLGLGPKPTSVTSGWPEGSRMLIYTDGLVETRDRRGVFFPLADYAAGLRHGTLEEALDKLVERLIEYAGHDVHDDMALVLAEHKAI